VILEEVSVANKDPPRGVSKTAASALSQRKTDTPYRLGIDTVARRYRPPVSADHRKGKIIGLGTRGGRPIAKTLNPRRRSCAIYRKLDSRVHPQALMHAEECDAQANGCFDWGPPMTTQNRPADFFRSTTGRVMFFGAAIIILLFFVFA